MTAFLLLGIPLFCTFYVLRNKNPKQYAAAFTGLFLSALVFVIRFFIFFSRSEHVEVFWINFLRAYVLHTFVPCLACPLVFFLFAKMNKEEKANSYLPLMLGFFSLFVPYNAYGEVSVFSSVELFALPLCYIFLTLIMRNLLLIGSILSIIVALLLSLFPAFIETIGYYSPSLACTILAVYGLICAVLQFSMRKLSSQSKTKQAVAMNNPSV